MKLFTFTQKSKSKMIYAFEITLPLFYKKLFMKHRIITAILILNFSFLILNS